MMNTASSVDRKRSFLRKLFSVFRDGWKGARTHENLLDSSVEIAIVGADLVGRINLWNAGAALMFGWSRGEAIGMPTASLFATDDRAAGEPERAIGRALSAGRCESDRVLRSRDGSDVWANCVTTPMLEGERILGTLSIIRRISPPDESPTPTHGFIGPVPGLRIHEDQFQTLAESIPQLAWMARPDGYIFWYNQRWYDYTGTTLDEMKGDGWRAVHRAELVEGVVARLSRALMSGEPWEDTFPLRCADGSFRMFLSRAMPIRDTAGEIIRWFGTNTDIEAGYQADLAGQVERTGLRQTVARQTNDLMRGEADLAEMKTSRDDAQSQVRQLQKMEALGQLTGGIAHDFNNMLAVVIGGLNLLQRRIERGDVNVAKYVDAAMDGALRAASLTQRLLAFSRQQPLAPETLDLNRFVGGLAELLARTLGETVRLETALGAGLWRTHVDASQLENAILNLAVNARDAMPGGGRLTIETSNAHIDDDYAHEHEIEPGQYTLLAVTDTGEGMPTDVIAKAFDPFFTTKRVGKGTGLGLSQVFGFVRQSRGHVKVYSELGVGTTVKVYLPRFFGTEEKVAAKKVASAIRGGTPEEVVLLVEDEDRVRMLSVDALREFGYTVIHASNGEEALAMIQSGQAVTLLFTDIVMPGMSGRQLADAALKIMPELKVLYTTGYTRNAVVHNGVLDPGVNFLSKPFSLDALASKVREALDA